MDPGPPPWQLALARIEGALPFLRAEVADGLARASLRRLWRIHVRDFCRLPKFRSFLTPSSGPLCHN